MKFLKRNLGAKILESLEYFPSVSILGPRQCGKSTLAKELAPKWTYFDLDRPLDFNLVTRDPLLFFREHPERVVIDESQKHPPLFGVLKSVIDEKRSMNGRFIFTGSSSPDLVKNISESLAGRVAIVELSPLKMNEGKGQSLSPFFDIFEKKISWEDVDFLKSLRSRVSFSQIGQFLLKGGYPGPFSRKNEQYDLQWKENYLKTYIDAVRALFPRLDLIKYRAMMERLPYWSGTLINNSEIARSVGVSEKAVRDYFKILEGSFLWRILPSYKTSKIKTSVSLSKGYYRDSGLFFHLQKIHSKKEMGLHPKIGSAFESFIGEEILRGIEATQAVNVKASHFRTKAGGEIDLILEGSFGMLPVEVKYQSHTRKKQLTSMINFIEVHKLPYGIVVNHCDVPSLITEKIIQIPAGCL